MKEFKTHLMQYLIEGDVNMMHKENLPSNPEEYKNLLNKFIDGEYVPKTGIEARNLSKHMNENNVGTDFIDNFASRLLSGKHKIKSRTHATEAMVGLSQHAHRDDDFFNKHKEGLINQGGVIAKEAQKDIPLRVRAARTGESISYKTKEPNSKVSSETGGSETSVPAVKDAVTKVDPNTEVTFSHEGVSLPSHNVLRGYNIVATSEHGSHHVGTVILHKNGDVMTVAHPFGLKSKPEIVSTTSGTHSDSKDRIVSGVEQIKRHYMNGGHIPTNAIDEIGLNIPMNRGGHEKGEDYVWRPTDEATHNVIGKVAAVHSRRGKSIVELVDKTGKRHFAHSDEIFPQEEKRPDAEFSMAR